MLSREEVLMAYRFILGRDPESESVIEHYRQFCPDLPTLRRYFINSEEFHSRELSPMADIQAPLSIDLELPAPLLQRFFRRVEDTWQALGRTEPHWSVASCAQFRADKFVSHASEFYATGKRDADRLVACLLRNRIDPAGISSCSEYGCGVGRVTAWLASRFPHVYGYDISSPHLQSARQYLAQKGITNVQLLKLDSLSSLCSLESVDLLYTIMVLQHNPPPVMFHVLRMLLRSLKADGIAYFQVPTYAVGYQFSALEYLRASSPSAASDLEMHVLPQVAIFDLLREQECRVLEVQPDSYVGSAQWVSNTFLVRKSPRQML
jgi:trans-aconitate methyltransferase